ncbi:pseudouridine synthase [Vreelandella venusta]|uniref:Pseudouridine synthase n=1 Tax=Vreelandella venusta TaxID=44935 RepID=A0AAP9ZNU0_9GAMM|nr:pseudouridine synthase [Halomonas venusta]MBR9923717.1 pseudouridine synthase [Gammaproteobacteria bacterium]AZM95825.1 pseudouridine synthase [Halomonas venusta]MDW0361083.1 pseudouridine synthase [Halomonas venusta]MDX1714486.1 pseudouridine synthase [Halomonas venusta]NPT30898.1 16S rRNA pseudouridine(516) synthase [Halomonas venusta]
MRLDRFLSETTPLTRSLAKRALKNGEVTLNGEPIKQSATQVDTQNDEIKLNGETLALVGLRYLMMHKPLEVECTARRGLYPRVIDLIDLPKAERLQPVGRLDVDTTGLLLLTDDGQWSHRVTSPRHRCAKVYIAELAEPMEGSAAEWAIRQVEEGLLLDGEETPTQPAVLRFITPQQAELTITEGRYHQVKRMFVALGNHVNALHRRSIGDVVLPDDLAPGEWRELTPEEIASF